MRALVAAGAAALMATACSAAEPKPAADPRTSAAQSPPADSSVTSSGNLDRPQGEARGPAAEAVRQLPVKGRAPQTGYSREMFGYGWVDVDRNGCDTRNDILQAQLLVAQMSGTCKVVAGELADPYTGADITFVYGGDSEVDVDHVVALSDAWQKGAAPWPFAKRVAFANDPLNLQATEAAVNRQKGDSDAATWLPPNSAYRCEYVAQQVAVKRKYEVWVTEAEQAAMLRILQQCPDQGLPSPGSQPTIAANTGGIEPPGANADGPAVPAPAVPDEGADRAVDARMPTCADAVAAGLGPYVSGRDPEYDWYRDADGDGVVCES